MATGRRRGRAFIYFALILILLVVLLFAVAQMGMLPFLGGGGSQTPTGGVIDTNNPEAAVPTPEPEKVGIYVVSQDIKRGEYISAERVILQEIDRLDDSEDMFHEEDRTELFASRAIADLKPATPLERSMVVGRGASAGIPSFEIPQGMVAVSIPVSKLSSVSYGLQKGDHVNLIVSLLFVDLDTNWQTKLPNRTGLLVAPGPVDENVTNISAYISSGDKFDPGPIEGAYSYMGRIEIEPSANTPVWVIQSEESRPRLISQTLLQDVVILQMGFFGQGTEELAQAAEATPDPMMEEEAAAPVEAGSPHVVTLVVTPQDAVTINYLLLSGASINMVMRSAGDSSRLETEAVTLQFLMDQYRIPNPAKLPYGTNKRIDAFPEFVPVFPDPVPTPIPLN